MCQFNISDHYSPVCLECKRIFKYDRWIKNDPDSADENKKEIPGLCPKCAKEKYPEININMS